MQRIRNKFSTAGSNMGFVGLMRLQAPPDHLDVLLVSGVEELPEQNFNIRKYHLILVQCLIAFILHKLDVLIQYLVHLFLQLNHLLRLQPELL